MVSKHVGVKDSNKAEALPIYHNLLPIVKLLKVNGGLFYYGLPNTLYCLLEAWKMFVGSPRGRITWKDAFLAIISVI